MITYSINEIEGLLDVNVKRQFSLSELAAAEDEIQADPAFRTGMPRLYDFRDVPLVLSTSELVSFVEVVRSWNAVQTVRVALITDGSTAGTLKLFAGHFQDQPVAVFGSRETATAWLFEESLDDISDDGNRYQTIVLRGPVSVDEILSAQMRWYGADDFDPDKPILWDLRDTNPTTSITELREKTPFVVSASNRAGRQGRTAVLVNTHLMQMLLSEMMSHSGWREESRVFTSAVEARDWVISS